MNNMDKEQRKKLEKQIQLGHIKKEDIPIGKVPIDHKFTTQCKDYYNAYDLCLKESQGDWVNCKYFRKSMEKCEREQNIFPLSQN
ncbi:hypothetical protein ABPG74_021263 [Tetrahymena malaccensis]